MSYDPYLNTHSGSGTSVPLVSRVLRTPHEGGEWGKGRFICVIRKSFYVNFISIVVTLFYEEQIQTYWSSALLVFYSIVVDGVFTLSLE